MQKTEQHPAWPSFATASGICTSIGMLNNVVILGLFLALGIDPNSLGGPIFLIICSKGISEWIFIKRCSQLIPPPSNPALERSRQFTFNLGACFVFALLEVACEISLLIACIHSGMQPAWAFFWLACCMAASGWLVGALAESFRKKEILIYMVCGCVATLFAAWAIPEKYLLLLLCGKGLLVHVTLMARSAVADTYFSENTGRGGVSSS